MQELHLMLDDEILPSGSVIRIYEVNRFDVMKTSFDRLDSDKRKLDFYDYLVVDINAIKKDTFSLINITRDNVNRGSILCEFGEVNVGKPLIAIQLKKYFGNNAKVFVEFNK